MRLQASLGVAAALALALAVPAEGLWGGKGSDVKDLTLHKELKAMEKSPYIWAIALYREGCGYCELLKPEWTKVGAKMRKMAGIAAVDVTTHSHIAKALQDKYRFNITGVPTVIMLKPTSDGKGKRKFMLNGRKSKAIVTELVDNMPEHVATITSQSYDGWEKRPGAKALLFTDKKDSPAVIKALSIKYKGRLHFGVVVNDDKKLKSKFSTDGSGKLFIIEDGKTVGSDYTPIPYKGRARFVTMDFFVMDYAAAKAKEASDNGGSDGTGNADDSKKDRKKDEKKKKKKVSEQPATPEEEAAKAEKEAKKTAAKQERKEKAAAMKAQRLERQKAEKKGGKKSTKKKLGGLRNLPQPDNPITLKDAKLDQLSIKDLRGILARWDDPCTSCIEKDQFLMKIAENRKAHGDMEAVAQSFAKKAARRNRKRTKANPDGGGDSTPEASTSGPADPFADDGEGGLCGRLLDMETEPLRKEIDKLRAENEELKTQLAAATEELVHEEL